MSIVSARLLKILITGADSFIGRQLVPHLRDAGCELLLVGRDPVELQARFPDVDSCSYDEIPYHGQGFDMLVHLEVLDNAAEASPDEFERVNVDMLASALTLAKAANIARFVNVTSFHALSRTDTPYTRSRRKGLEIVEGTEGIEVFNLFLPTVYGDEFSGKLSLITRVPGFLRGAALTFLTAMAPSVQVERVARFLAGGGMGPDRNVFLANPQHENIVFRIGKFLLDLSFIVALIGVWWWLLLIVWILIPLDSPGRGIFAQRRIGQNGKEFTVYKFRTMKCGTRQAGTHEMSSASVTRMGAFLRKTKLDELPQVLNVVIGNVSLVGPRPCLPVQTQLIEERQKRGVFAVKPGITGLAQINDIDMSDPVKLARWDARYIAQRSLPSELKIAAATFLGRGASDKLRK